MTNREAELYAENAAARLFEQFDHVLVLVSWNEDGTTRNLSRGCGNWFARKGMAHDFIERGQAIDQAEEIAAKLNPETL